MSIRNSDDWTIDRWRPERRFDALEIDDPPDLDYAPTLWKDVTLALVVAVVLWATTAGLFGESTVFYARRGLDGLRRSLATLGLGTVLPALLFEARTVRLRPVQC